MTRSSPRTACSCPASNSDAPPHRPAASPSTRGCAASAPRRRGCARRPGCSRRWPPDAGASRSGPPRSRTARTGQLESVQRERRALVEPLQVQLAGSPFADAVAAWSVGPVRARGMGPGPAGRVARSPRQRRSSPPVELDTRSRDGSVAGGVLVVDHSRELKTARRSRDPAAPRRAGRSARSSSRHGDGRRCGRTGDVDIQRQVVAKSWADAAEREGRDVPTRDRGSAGRLGSVRLSPSASR